MEPTKNTYASFYRKRQLVGMMYALKAIKKGQFKLSSGKDSQYYIDGRVALLDPETLALVASQMGELISQYVFDSMGCMEGPGSTALLGALLVGYGSLRTNRPVSGFVVRKAAKLHGTAKMVEGLVGDAPVIIDDVATSGKSILHVIENMLIKPIAAVVLLDREEGAKEILAGYGIPLRSILTMSDLTL